MSDARRTPWLFWPFVAVWRLLTWILGLTGRLVAVAVGMALMIAGAVLTATMVGAIAGVPLMMIGILLLLRGLF